MSALDKVLLAAGWGTQLEDPAAEMTLAARLAVARLVELSKKDPDDDGDDDSSGKDGGKGDTDNDAGHVNHPLFKKLKARGVPDAQAAKMCARADQKAEMCALASSAQVLLSALFEDGLVMLAAPPGESASDRRSLAEKGWALSDGSYPMPDAKHVHSAAVLAASHHGNWKAALRLIPKMAKIHGVKLSTLPGFGGEKDADDKKVAATVALAAGNMSGTPAQPHAPFHGVHSHAHVHHGDNMHGGSSDRMPGHFGY